MSLDGEAFLQKYGRSSPPTPADQAHPGNGHPARLRDRREPRHQLQPLDRRALAAHRQDLGGTKLQGDHNRSTAQSAAPVHAGAWMSSEESKKGALEAGKLADLAILSGDYFAIRWMR